MKAFLNDYRVKKIYLSRVKAHQKADQVTKGYYWEAGKGCAVGCTIHGSEHALYESELGIPAILAHLEDGIFEGLPNARAMKWPEQFLSSIKVGANLSKVWVEFCIWMLQDQKQFVKKDLKATAAIDQVTQVYINWFETGVLDLKAASAASSASYAAASASYASYASYASASYAADAAARSASYAAASASYASYASYASASYAADAAAARSAASSASYAAASASYASYASYASASYAARDKYYIKMADKLLQLLKKAKK